MPTLTTLWSLALLLTRGALCDWRSSPTSVYANATMLRQLGGDAAPVATMSYWQRRALAAEARLASQQHNLSMPVLEKGSRRQQRQLARALASYVQSKPAMLKALE